MVPTYIKTWAIMVAPLWSWSLACLLRTWETWLLHRFSWYPHPSSHHGLVLQPTVGKQMPLLFCCSNLDRRQLWGDLSSLSWLSSTGFSSMLCLSVRDSSLKNISHVEGKDLENDASVVLILVFAVMSLSGKVSTSYSTIDSWLPWTGYALWVK